ncbi:hypothetical protein CCO03_02080 [Comamonas serinivorans]|uniref:Glycosyl transferase family 1 n=1 Tax=Comamonas serinivorans TaxID=1082851 RepID=A0A1Y0EJ16_9BURK|nr:glycosyltransferase [Comamonas serinivorans]ARU03635.1 hypothetical protein CCO03_02080 [Comamonas serinivorans]
MKPHGTPQARGRVLHVGKFFPPDRGGIESYLADLMAQQQAMGLEVAALVHGTPRPDDPPWLIRVPVQAEVVYAPIALGMVLALRRALRQFQPDVLHLHMPNLAVFWALFLHHAMAVPWVVHWHSDVMVNPKRLLLNLAYRFYEPFERRMLRGAQAVIATSPAYLRHSQTLWPWRGKAVAIPLGLRRLPGTAEPVAGVPACDRPFRVLSIGRLAHYKGFGVLIDAVAQCPGVVLRIVGDGELRAVLAQQIQALPQADARERIQLLGAVDDAQKWRELAACDLFALASTEKSEAFGLVVLEAMQFGKPCLVSQLSGSGLPWLLDTAQAGMTAPVGEVAAWRDAVFAMAAAWRAHVCDEASDAAARWRRWVSQAHQAAHGDFSMQTNARSVMAVYERLWPEWLEAERPLLAVMRAGPSAAEGLDAQVRGLRAIGFDVLVIDEGLGAATVRLVQAAGAEVLRTPLPQEAWGSLQLGLRWARVRRYAQVLTLSAGQVAPADIDLLRRQPQHDVVIASRGRRLPRRLAWSWFRGLTGLNVRDLSSPVRLYGREAVAVLASREATMLAHEDLGSLLLLQRSRLSMVEVEVPGLRLSPDTGWRSWWRGARDLMAGTVLGLSRIDTPPWRPRTAEHTPVTLDRP